MKYLITGGAGFIGSNLAEELVSQNHQVIIVDNLTTGSLNNIAKIKDKITFIQANAADVLTLEQLSGINGIYHLGIPSTTLLYRNNPMLVGKAINEFIAILELAKKEKCKVVYASSSSLYNGNKPPFREDMPVLVKDFYTEARYLMERLAQLYYDFYEVQSIGFRFFSVYGPHEEAKKTFANLVSQFLWAMKNNEPPVIYGDGAQTRDFTYVSDIVRGFIMGMKSNINCGIFNLGTGHYYNLNELVSLLNKLLKTNIRAVYQKNPLKNYVMETQADTAKVKKYLGWEARVSLEEGILNILKDSAANFAPSERG